MSLKGTIESMLDTIKVLMDRVDALGKYTGILDHDEPNDDQDGPGTSFVIRRIHNGLTEYWIGDNKISTWTHSLTCASVFDSKNKAVDQLRKIQHKSKKWKRSSVSVEEVQ